MKRISKEKLSALVEGVRNSPAKKAVLMCSKALPIIAALCFAARGAYLVIAGDERALRFLLVPAIAFIAVTIIRKAVNAPRPCEVYGIEPLDGKRKQGLSCPSRHTASAAIIAAAFLYLSVPLGIAMSAAAAAIAVLRVITGAHFPRDVILGAAFSAVCGVLGFIII